LETRKYPVKIYYREGKGYNLFFPDFPGCTERFVDEESARREAGDVLQRYLNKYYKYCGTLPRRNSALLNHSKDTSKYIIEEVTVIKNN